MKYSIKNQIAAIQTARIALADADYKEALTEAWQTLEGQSERIKSLEDALQSYVNLHKVMVDERIINPALGAPIRATAKALLNH